MAVSDTKKTQSAINRVGLAIKEVRASVAKMDAVIVKFRAVNPSVVGTPLDKGKSATLLAAINSLRAEINTPIWDGVVSAIVPSHRGEAL